MENWYWIVVISTLGPVLGSFLGVVREPSERFMFNMLSFAAGVMLAISFLDLIPESIAFASVGLSAAGVLAGAMVMYLLDKLIPHLHPELCEPEQGLNLKKTSTYLLLGIFLHNFPEGMAIAVGTVSEAKVTLVLALAIAIHNVPEGVCTATSFYHSSGRRWKTFLVSSSTAIPILVGYAVAARIYQVMPRQLIGVIIAATAGLMIYISADELIPTSSSKLTNHSTIFSLVTGVLFVLLLGGL